MIFFILEAIITANSISMNQVSQDSIEKPEEPARSRHCVSERICRRRHWGNLGRRRGAMNWSQENCLIDDHRLTCERRGGDLRLAPNRSASLRHRFGCGFMRFDAAHGKARIFCSLSFLCRKRGCIYFANERTQSVLLFANVQPYALCVHRFHRCRRKMLSGSILYVTGIHFVSR